MKNFLLMAIILMMAFVSSALAGDSDSLEAYGLKGKRVMVFTIETIHATQLRLSDDDNEEELPPPMNISRMVEVDGGPYLLRSIDIDDILPVQLGGMEFCSVVAWKSDRTSFKTIKEVLLQGSALQQQEREPYAPNAACCGT